MSDEKKESKVKVNDLPEPEQELTDEEANQVKGGLGLTTEQPNDERGGTVKLRSADPRDTP